MFNWVVKVVPQPPPGGPGALGEDTTKPAAGGKDGKKSSDDGESSEERNRVINWVAQSLTQSLTRAGLPQPDEKYREKPFEDVELTEVFEVNQLPDYDPLPHIPVVEMESDEEIDMQSLHPTQQVVNWIKQAMPQPALPGAIETSPRPPKRSTTSLDKVVSPPPQSLSGISLDTDDKAGMVGWFRSGLGLRMPQLVIKPKDESPTAADVLQKASADMVLEDVDSDNEGQLKAETSQPLRSVSSGASVASAQPALRSVSSERSAAQASEPEPPAAAVEDEVDDAAAAGGEPPATQTVGTDTGRWTPFIDSIKKEAEGVAMATMEERLLEERAEMARLAEDVARQAAERAIKELTEEGSIKLSLGSRELLDDEDQPGDAQEPDAELQRLPIEPPEEGSEEEAGAEPEAEAEPDPSSVQSDSAGGVSSVIRFCTHRSHSEAKCRIAIVTTSELPPEPEPIDPQEEEATAEEPTPEPTKSSGDQEPEEVADGAGTEAAATEAEAEPEPEVVVTQQPKKADQASLAAATVSADASSAANKEEERSGEVGCAPASCESVLKSCLMRIPHASDCLGNISAFFKENGIAAPKVHSPSPSMPAAATSPSSQLFSDIASRFPSLPPELRTELANIRLTQVPLGIASTLAGLFSGGPSPSPAATSPSQGGASPSGTASPASTPSPTAPSSSPSPSSSGLSASAPAPASSSSSSSAPAVRRQFLGIPVPDLPSPSQLPGIPQSLLSALPFEKLSQIPASLQNRLSSLKPSSVQDA